MEMGDSQLYAPTSAHVRGGGLHLALLFLQVKLSIFAELPGVGKGQPSWLPPRPTLRLSCPSSSGFFPLGLKTVNKARDPERGMSPLKCLWGGGTFSNSFISIWRCSHPGIGLPQPLVTGQRPQPLTRDGQVGTLCYRPDYFSKA